MRTRTILPALMVLGFSFGAWAEDAKPVSFAKDIVPILSANCSGCHKPDKSKGDLDLTTFAAAAKGGKHGKTIVPGKPEESELYLSITGDPPEMPEEGDPLKPAEIELIRLWIEQGAVNDSKDVDELPAGPPVYSKAPVVSSMAVSPDGSLLAVAGYHEVILHKSDGSGIVARLVGRAPRIEGLAFSPDGSQLAVCGGAPGLFGHVQIWNVAEAKLIVEHKIGYDSLYGISFSPNGQTVAFGGADKVVRQLELSTGKILMEFRAHADWVFGTAYTLDGQQVVSAGRDKAIKLINLETQRFVDDINNPRENVVSFARHPKEEQVVYGGQLGGVYQYRISDNQQRTAGRNDTNLVRMYENQAEPVHGIAFSPDGSLLAVGSVGRVRVYETAEGKLRYEAKDLGGPVYAIAWKPDGSEWMASGFDGQVRRFAAADGRLIATFSSAPIQSVANR